jgi:soluble lytic murein transglycosylase-like protein
MTMNKTNSFAAIVLILSPCLSTISKAEIFVYRADNGQRIVTDKPMRQVDMQLISFGEPGNSLFSQSSAGTDNQYDALIKQASLLYGVEFELIKAVVRAESAFDPMAVSHKGAVGLMQLMPATATRFGVTDSTNPKQNIFAGTRYLRYLLNIFNQNTAWALAGYNAGETRVREYGGIPPYKETENYVQKVLAFYAQYQ